MQNVSLFFLFFKFFGPRLVYLRQQFKGARYLLAPVPVNRYTFSVFERITDQQFEDS